MITVYVIKSLSKNFRYVGITNDLKKRLSQHGGGQTRSTKPYIPFELIHTEEYDDYKQARERERFLKSGVGRKYLNSLI